MSVVISNNPCLRIIKNIDEEALYDWYYSERENIHVWILLLNRAGQEFE